uniref:Uncharacterized protein n=1 Tax=Seriola dumerili TaxID=41447 RepID=A0A3B4TKC2_SERDU
MLSCPLKFDSPTPHSLNKSTCRSLSPFLSSVWIPPLHPHPQPAFGALLPSAFVCVCLCLRVRGRERERQTTYSQGFLQYVLYHVSCFGISLHRTKQPSYPTS